MSKSANHRAVVIGDSFNNTLGLIRSLGEAGVQQTLLLVGGDRLFVSRSRYIKKSNVYRVDTIEDCLPLLHRLADGTHEQVIICSNDNAAAFVDRHEEILCKNYITPMSGRHLGNYMNKQTQCDLAVECGFDVPKSAVYRRGGRLPQDMTYPLLLKPLVSIDGEKSDIHICRDACELDLALASSSHCEAFVVQEYIEKEYEINLIGVSTDSGVVLPGGIKKIRHYPTIYSPCSFGLYKPVEKFNFDISVVQRFMDKVGYRGPFSVELLHKAGRNYFMEVNFRHDGLAYTATAAGVNLPGLYMQSVNRSKEYKIREIYMMDLSIDFCHYKDRKLGLGQWISDYFKTDCQLNFNIKDPMPTICYYISKFRRKIGAGGAV